MMRRRRPEQLVACLLVCVGRALRVTPRARHLSLRAATPEPAARASVAARDDAATLLPSFGDLREASARRWGATRPRTGRRLARCPPDEDDGGVDALKVSRSRLYARDAADYAGAPPAGDSAAPTLLARFARALCGLDGVVPRKELHEAWATAALVTAEFPRATRVVDVGAGAGLLGWALLLQARALRSPRLTDERTTHSQRAAGAENACVSYRSSTPAPDPAARPCCASIAPCLPRLRASTRRSAPSACRRR